MRCGRAMSDTSLAVLAREIERRAHRLSGVLLRDGRTELDCLRDEAALLQSAIDQATRLQRLMLDRGPGAAMLTPVVIETSAFAGFGLVRNLTDLGMTAKDMGTVKQKVSGGKKESSASAGGTKAKEHR